MKARSRCHQRSMLEVRSSELQVGENERQDALEQMHRSSTAMSRLRIGKCHGKPMESNGNHVEIMLKTSSKQRRKRRFGAKWIEIHTCNAVSFREYPFPFHLS